MIVFVLLAFTILIFYYDFTKNHNYWASRGIKFEKPVPYFGNFHKVFFRLQSLTQFSTELYQKYPNEKVVGLLLLSRPMLLIRDLDLVKRVLTADFQHFSIRGAGRNREKETHHQNVFHEEGDRWKLLRAKLTPIFTSAKLKAMFPLVIKCAKKLEKAAEEIVARGGDFKAQDVAESYTTELVGTCGFGIEMDTMNSECSLFGKIANLMSNPPLKTKIRMILWDFFPFLRRFLHVIDPRAREYIGKIVKEVMKQRSNKPSTRNDYIDYMIKLLEEGKIEGESMEKKNTDGSPVKVEMKVDFSVIVAQVYIFFAASFDTSSMAISYTLHELAYNPEIQRLIQEDIDRALEKHGELSYNAVADMPMLQMAFHEALRLFSPGGTLIRICSKKYTFPELNLTLYPGQIVWIPMQAIYLDDRYYNEPIKFIPERFAPENVQKRHKYAYMPFGEGPRMCVGSRLGEMQSLAGLASILHKFTVEPSKESTRKLKIDPTRNIIQGVLGGIPLKLKLRE